MASSDTIVMGGVPKGSFVINRDSAIANKEIIEDMYKNKKNMKSYMGGGKVAPIKVGADEVIFSPEDVQQYGMNFMMALNQKPIAHENIDNLIASSQLENMQSFKRGGYVTPGGGTTMRRPRGGNPTSMMGYEDGGVTKKEPRVGLLGEVSSDEFDKMLAELKMNVKEAQAAADIASEKRKGLELLYGNLDFDDSMLLPDAPATPEKDILKAILNQALDKNAVLPPKKKQYLVPRSNRKFDWRNFNQGGIVEYEDGGSVDPRDLPTNTGANQGMISPFWGDQPPIPPAWMEPATEMVQTPEEAAAFQNQINMLLVQEALNAARQAGEQVQPETLRMSNEAYSLEQLMPMIDNKMQNRIQFPIYQEKNPMSNLGRSWIDR